MVDFDYRIDRAALCVRLYPNTPDAQHNLNMLHAHYGYFGCEIQHWPDIRARLKKLGFTFAPARKIGERETDAILAELLDG